ncbi:hypothetical protein GE09DRAFT_1088687 [Coniochaeta sp. 2T2.1]|nr:hypothetical protein GE09DRAFT_1088687 [Coniochaeta sp. 2T2.1]
MATIVLSLILLASQAFSCARRSIARAAVPPTASIGPPDRTTSNINNIYRDGGGGGRINGKDFLIFSDSIYTDGAVPDSDGTAHWRNFTSNPIALSGCNSDSVTRLCDFGTAEKGPFEQIPFFPDEDSQKTATWPNQGIATLCDGTCGVSFPVVVNRTESAAGRNGDLYDTGIKITLSGDRPAVERLTRSLFVKGEPLFGSFGTLVGVDGYLHMFASITHLDNGANGLKMARVPQGSWSVRGAYQFWTGTEWTNSVPAYNDSGKANIFNWSERWNGVEYGPGAGDLFFSPDYGCHILLFMSDTPATDANGESRLAKLSKRRD